jgi:4-hydroxybenzoyl-CoA reductase subunit beta
MRLPYFDFSGPETLHEVLAVMERYGEGARLHAGGTDVISLMRLGLLRPSHLVGLKNVTGLRGIRRQGQTLRIGAMTTLSELTASEAVRQDAPGLYDAALSVAAPPIRNMATIGGNIFQGSRCLFYNQSAVWRLERAPCLKAGGESCLAVPKGKKCFSLYQGDIAPALIASGARVKIEKRKAKPREVPVEELFTGQGREPVRLAPGEVATEVVVPIFKHAAAAYAKLRLRSAVDYPFAGAAAFVAVGKKRIESARLVLSAAGPAPVIVPLDGLVAGKAPSAVDLDAIGRSVPRGLPLVDNHILPASYRRKMLAVFAMRAMEAALRRI